MMATLAVLVPEILAGVVVGIAAGFLGGGGSILSVPLLLYGAGIVSPHLAIGTSAFAVASVSALSLLWHSGMANVDWRVARIFASAGIVGAALASIAGQSIQGPVLVFFLGFLMLGVAALMAFRPADEVPAGVAATTGKKPLVASGFAAGLLSGLFGVSAGFMIVPALRIVGGLPMFRAVGTSLAISSAFASIVAASYAASGLVVWSSALAMVGGGVVGSVVGVGIGRLLSTSKRMIEVLFAITVGLTGLYVLVRGVP